MANATFGNLGEFNPQEDDIEIYTDRLEQFFLANQIQDEARKAAILLTTIGNDSYKLLLDLTVPKKPKEHSYNELLELLKSQLRPKRSIFAERYKFYSASQLENESIEKWATRLKHLAKFCNFGSNLEEALRDKFIVGLKDTSTLNRLFLEVDTVTFGKAFEIAASIEAARIHTNQIKEKNKGSPVYQLQKQQVQNTTDNTKHHKKNVKTSDKYARKDQEPKKSCNCCGRDNHNTKDCRFLKYKCKRCGKTGHLIKVCRSKDFSVNRSSQAQNLLDQKDGDEAVMNNVQSEASSEPIMIQVDVAGKRLEMQLDTGASVSVISKELYEKHFWHIPIEKSTIILKGFCGKQVSPLGSISVQVKYNNVDKTLKLHVVPHCVTTLLGRDWLKELNIPMPILNVENAELREISEDYNELFKDELGTFNKHVLKLCLREDAKPKFCKPRPLPYALRNKVDKELDRLIAQGIIEPTDHSEWGTPIVPIIKPDGQIRLCGDYRITLNPALKVDKYPLPRIEDLLIQLEGGQEFSKIDLSQAYLQCSLEEESKKLVTISTHRGLFKYNRLPFGVASAPAQFQKLMEQLLQGIPKVVCFLDDILVTGKDREEHQKHLREVLNRLQESGLRIKEGKCEFFQKCISYLGYVIDKEGLHTSEEKVKAIREAPTPKNIHQLRAFLGMINYYGKFIKDLAQILHPLYALLNKKQRWVWNAECEQAFIKIKEMLTSSKVLVHYNEDLPIKMSCDASPYGVGAVLSHIYPNGEERPIAYASRTLSKAEKNYSQIDKEALSIIFGLKRFQQYLICRKFTIATDHKPLIHLFNPKKSVPAMVASRLQRWCLLLSGHDYEIEYVPSEKHGNADGLSRLPLTETVENIINYSYLHYAHEGPLPISAQQVARETQRDKILSKVTQYVSHGWPRSHEEIDTELKPFWCKRDELNIEQNCIMWGYRVVIPLKLRLPIKQELHKTHMGIVKMKTLARSYVWWPNIDKDLEEMAKTCSECMKHKDMPPKATLNPWPWTDRPWWRIHVDYFKHVEGKSYLLVTDVHSKWVEAFEMKSTGTTQTIQKLRELCARYGLPDQIVTDNGGQFTSDEFLYFVKSNGITHIRTAPYHPATNGAAEIVVKMIKSSLRKMKGNSQDILNKILLQYRVTKHCTTGETPAKLMMGRELRTRLDLLRPSTAQKVQQNQQKQVKNFRGRRKETFKEGDQILMREYKGRKATWIPAEIEKVLSSRSYILRDKDGNQYHRHVDQLLRRN